VALRACCGISQMLHTLAQQVQQLLVRIARHRATIKLWQTLRLQGIIMRMSETYASCICSQGTAGTAMAARAGMLPQPPHPQQATHSMLP
jgi:hypothetical protein